MDVSKNISRKLSDSSLQRYQEGALLQNDYLVDFLHSDNFWVDIIAMGVSSNQESDFVPISSPKSYYDEKLETFKSPHASPNKLSSVFPLDIPATSTSTQNPSQVTCTLTKVPSFRSLTSSPPSVFEETDPNNDDCDRDSSVYDTAVALSDVTLSDLTDSVHNDDSC
eukprot:CAMPEP_0170077284 /NCGR_PEP_ID=MMETSP0019_2-20121128/14130_1 /TAXON_ID=98059 /ORGANISM="Dinobryon sp., Strain UTEXLB2267" /LENGTH=166 /DNA_ID=CAMNT_0010289517 /DNA_START=255 /DNA_END=755 /DNA_ORIENTATION=+